MDMQDTVLITVFSSVVVGFLGWGATILKRRLAEAIDRRTIYSWLQGNTKDEPGESHVEAVVIAKGTRLSENQVRRVCMSDSLSTEPPMNRNGGVFGGKSLRASTRREACLFRDNSMGGAENSAGVIDFALHHR